jgi:hypothetical protein
MTPGDRVTQLYPQALGTHFSRLLRHAWVTVGLFFNPGHHTGLLRNTRLHYQVWHSLSLGARSTCPWRSRSPVHPATEYRPEAAELLVTSPWRWGGSSTQAWMPTYVSILRIPQMIWVWRATMEWYWQGKTEELGEKPVPVPLCPSQISHGLTRARIRASAVRGRRLTTWDMARPYWLLLNLVVSLVYRASSTRAIRVTMATWDKQ